MSYWIYKCNVRARSYARAWGDWWEHVFKPGGKRAWGLTTLKGVESVRVGDVLLAYQTDRNELVGTVRVTGFEPDGAERRIVIVPTEIIRAKVRPLKRDPRIRALSALAPGDIRTAYPIPRVRDRPRSRRPPRRCRPDRERDTAVSNPPLGLRSRSLGDRADDARDPRGQGGEAVPQRDRGQVHPPSAVGQRHPAARRGVPRVALGSFHQDGRLESRDTSLARGAPDGPDFRGSRCPPTPDCAGTSGG